MRERDPVYFDPGFIGKNNNAARCWQFEIEVVCPRFLIRE